MTLPNKICLLGTWIDVEYLEHIEAGTDEITVFGDFCEVQKKIRVRIGEPEEMERTLLHELIHAIFSITAWSDILQEREEGVAMVLEHLAGIFTLKKDSKLLKRKLRPSSKVSAANLRQRKNAHQKVAYAVKTGKLVRPNKCPKCKAKGKIQAHHHDYDQPLSVVWLCSRCHKKAHSEA